MLGFKQFVHLVEEAKAGARGIQHLPHAAESAFHPDKEHLDSTINRIHEIVSGKAPLSRKIDDRMSFQVKKDPDGRVAVKYKGSGAKYNYSQKDIDTQHSNKPHVAAPLSAILAHVHKVLPDAPGEYQGGFLSTPETRTTENGHVSHTPNTIKYSHPTNSEDGKNLAKSKLSIILHSKLDDSGKPSPVGANEFKSHPDVHVMNPVVTDEERRIDPKTKQVIANHLNAASELARKHTHAHHEGHEADLVSYGNSGFDTNQKLNVNGYKKFVSARKQKEMDKLKSDAGKNKKRAELDAAMQHLDKHADKFNRSFEIYHHIQKATETLADSLTKTAHGGYKTHIGDKQTGGEGFVSGDSSSGQHYIKVVPREFTVANRQRSAQFQAQRAASK